MRRDSDVMLLYDHLKHSKKLEADNELPHVTVVHMPGVQDIVARGGLFQQHVERQVERVDSAVARHIKVHSPIPQCN
jgi:citrate lyase synthetase